ncbi:Major capsid [Gossypium australe]|uniref:Major capsid n=1 Tax=Gossypium australe TaxID=47621 RepID=A0A5B6UD24_9ROSI|nr:Major capsid [Gossypium australe]
MATSAFKSTTRRASLANSPGDSSSSNRSPSGHRRARSLSRFSRRIPGVGDDDDEPTPAPRSRGRFVNTVRGSGFPEISLDDLAVELFDSSLRGRSVSRMDDVTPRNGKGGGGGGGESVAQRRGRSVSRQGSRGSVANNGAGGRFTSDTASSRRRRSVSVVRYQISDSESDLDQLQNPSNHASMKSSMGGNNQLSSTHKPTASNNRQGLRRSLSQKDLKYHDGYSSHSSAVTDDEGRDAALSNKNGAERTIKAVYAQKKGDHPIGDDVNGGLYAAMRKELRHAVEEIKTQLEQSMVKTKNSGIANVDTLQPDNSDVIQAISTARRKCTTKLEKSEKRRQDLLAEILLEEQHGRELSKIVKELLPEPKSSIVEKPVRARKRSNDRYRMSRQLTEEAEKYIEDFISNVEDTDISSLDGDRSDTTSSSIGGITKTPIFQNPAVFKSVPVEMDGVLLPWLQWETSNDVSPLSCENKCSISQEAVSGQDLSDQLTNSSSRGSWSPEFSDCTPSQNVAFGNGNYQSQTTSSSNKMMMKLDLDDYINTGSDEDFLHEMWSQRHGINSGKLLLCNHVFF